MEQPEPAQLVAIATITKPVGLKGQCAVHCEGDTLGLLTFPRTVFIGASAQDVRPVTLLEIIENAKGLQVCFEGFGDRTTAESLRGVQIFVHQRDLPPLDEGRFYHFELNGMCVVDTDGKTIGTVSGITSYPTVDVLEVSSGKGSLTIAVPMTPQTLSAIDRANKTIVVFSGSFDEIS